MNFYLQKLLVFVSLTLLCCFNLYAQKLNKYNYSFEFGGFYSTNNKIPFWLKNNQFGAYPLTGNTIMLRQAIESKIDTSKRFFKSNYCADLILVVGNQAQIVIPELYYKVDLGKWALLFGRKKQIHGLVDSTLSSGSITWSGNAVPIPEIQLSIPEYRKFIFNFLAVKGHFSHGWFGEQTSVRNFYLHQKSLYGRIGRKNSKLKLYGGILHNAQWGGKPKYNVPENDPRFLSENKFAVNWFVYKNIVIPVSNTGLDSSSGYSQYDYENRFGNHIGQLDLGGEYAFKKSKMLFYKQIIFETGQTFSSLTNIDDGLYGVSFTNIKPNAKIKKAVIEVLQTTNQGIYRAGLLRLIGFYGRHFGRNQNYYFNHGQYLDGWSYNGQSLGTPFMIPDGLIRNEKNELTSQLFSNNNRIKALYVGLNTQLNSINIESRFSYSRNFGSPRVDIGVSDQLSLSFKTFIPAPKLKGLVTVAVGMEQGDLIDDNYGVFLSFKRLWR